LRERDTKKQKTKMNKLINKLLGLNVLIEAMVTLKNENENLKKALAELEVVVADLETKVNDIETPDMDDYVAHCDLDDNIETYLNNNDYATQSYVDDEVENKVSDAVESAVEDLDLTDKVKEVVDDMDKASFGDTEELEGIVRKEVKSFMLNSVKIDFIVR
jgi:uncharacterized membrane-anchored protein YjiN (DUF445 family)